MVERPKMQRLLTGELINAKLERWRATADGRELQINLFRFASFAMRQ